MKKFITGEMVQDQNIVEVPPNLKYKGKVSVWFGIWLPQKNKRLKPKTDLEVRHRSVKIAEIEIK